VDYSSKANSPNVRDLLHDLLVAKTTLHSLDRVSTYLATVDLTGREVFVNFRRKKSCTARARCARVGLTVYPPWIQIPDVAAASSQSCDRKSKFGLRHDHGHEIQLN
jgi:hypothetical protein